MTKRRFGVLLRRGREAKRLSLRQLAERVDIDYSRLAKIESGTRPAPGLAEVRRLSDALDLDMANLIVASGTSREVMEHLLWSERLQEQSTGARAAGLLPEQSMLLEKNTFSASVLTRDGAFCTVKLGGARLRVFSFSDAETLIIRIPPEALVLHRTDCRTAESTAENVLEARVMKVRNLGQLTNLVLRGRGFDLNSLQGRQCVEALELSVGDQVFATIPSAAISTSAVGGDL
jgi:transcriptional regulator with XRE-family HTH domain